MKMDGRQQLREAAERYFRLADLVHQPALADLVREIAEKLKGGYLPGSRRRLAHRERALGGQSSDPHPSLLAEGELREFAARDWGLRKAA